MIEQIKNGQSFDTVDAIKALAAALLKLQQQVAALEAETETKAKPTTGLTTKKK